MMKNVPESLKGEWCKNYRNVDSISWVGAKLLDDRPIIRLLSLFSFGYILMAAVVIGPVTLIQTMGFWGSLSATLFALLGAGSFTYLVHRNRATMKMDRDQFFNKNIEKVEILIGCINRSQMKELTQRSMSKDPVFVKTETLRRDASIKYKNETSPDRLGSILFLYLGTLEHMIDKMDENVIIKPESVNPEYLSNDQISLFRELSCLTDHVLDAGFILSHEHRRLKSAIDSDKHYRSMNDQIRKISQVSDVVSLGQKREAEQTFHFSSLKDREQAEQQKIENLYEASNDLISAIKTINRIESFILNDYDQKNPEVMTLNVDAHSLERIIQGERGRVSALIDRIKATTEDLSRVSVTQKA